MILNLKYFHYYNLYHSLLYYIILLVYMRKTDLLSSKQN